MTNSTTSRRYPRRRITGPVVVVHSTRPHYPKYHLLADCEGLQATPEEARDVTEFSTVLDLAVATSGRPCRICALESVLIGCADPKPKPARDTFITFTSQANPKNSDAGVLSYDWHAATPSGIARLTRLAKRLQLNVTHTVSGPVAYGLLSADGARAIAANLRAVTRPGPGDPPPPAVVETLWTLLGDNPPEIAEVLGEEIAIDPWKAAVALNQ